MLALLLLSVLSLDKKEAGYLSFTIESRNRVDIFLNASNIAVLLFHANTAHAVDIEVKTRRNTQKIVDFGLSSIMINGETLSITNKKNKQLEIDLWVLPNDYCKNTGLLMYTQAEINYNVAIPNPKEPVCIFNLGYGTTRTTLNVVPSVPQSDITFYRSADFGGASQPYLCKGGCTFETSQSHFVQIKPKSEQHTEIPISFSGAMSLSNNLSCSTSMIPFMSGSESLNTKSFGGSVLGANCALGLSGDRVAVQLTMIFLFIGAICLIVFVSWKMIEVENEPRQFIIDKPADEELLSQADTESNVSIDNVNI